MGDVGGHLAAEVAGAGEVGTHLVEGGCQLAQLVPRAHRNRLIEISGGDRPGGSS
jgi:hypothetical protein